MAHAFSYLIAAAPVVASFFIEHWNVPHGILYIVIVDNGPLIMFTVFVALCVSVRAKPRYSQGISSAIERVSKNVYLNAGRSNVALPHWALNGFGLLVERVTYSHKTQLHRPTWTSPFCLSSSWKLQGCLTIVATTAEEVFRPSSAQAVLKIVSTRLWIRKGLLNGVDFNAHYFSHSTVVCPTSRYLE